jgi:hypothetical protein
MGSPDPEREFQAAIVDTVRIYEGRSVRVPSTATEVGWRNVSDRDDADVDRYGFIHKALSAGIDAANIRVYRGQEWGNYWIVDLEDGRKVVLTDDTEDYVIWVEGPWPFAATFSSPAGVRTEVDHSIGDLMTRIVTWCTGDESCLS